MILLLMRHGEALPVGGAITDDSQRPLSSQGLTQVRRVADGLKQKDLAVEKVISSPLVRARETAGIVTQVFGLSKPETSPVLSPSAAPTGLRTLLDDRRPVQGMLWVGHHPDVTVWMAYLTGLDPSVCPIFGTASVAALRLDSDSKKAEFLWFQP